MCLALARLTTTAMARLTASRRFRDVAGIIAIIPLILLGPIIGSAAEGLDSVLDWLPNLVAVLGFTPLGVFAALPGDLAAGHLAAGALRLVLGLAYLGRGALGVGARAAHARWKTRWRRAPAPRPWAWAPSASSRPPRAGRWPPAP